MVPFLFCLYNSYDIMREIGGISMKKTLVKNADMLLLLNVINAEKLL